MENKSNKICDIIHNSNIAFGTSGARGLVVDFKQDVCTAFIQSFYHLIKDKFSFSHVALAIDNRPSSYSIVQYCASALRVLNIPVIYYGVIPTPALALKAKNDSVPCIMITGSHIPFDRNGIKFYTPDGELTKKDESILLNCEEEIVCGSDFDLSVDNGACDFYIKRYSELYDDKPLSGKLIGIYEHSSAGRDLYSIVFENLGAKVVPLDRSDVFVPIDTEAVSDSDRGKAKNWCQEFKLDAIFSTDGDGDRPLVADENGIWLRGDILGLLCAEFLSIKNLATPINCTSAIDIRNSFSKIVRTKIGSPYVIEALSDMSCKDGGGIAGFEANGGFILGSDIIYNNRTLQALPTRDALLPAIIVMVESFKTSTISQCVSNLPQRFTFSDRITDYPSNKSRNLIFYAINSPSDFINKIGLRDFCVLSVNQLDGVRITASNGDIIHLRASGNAPELRCYAESDTNEKAEKYVKWILKSIEDNFS
ncbi:TPA: phosphomannomutase [Escherichia coli]|uniref:Phosphomannomutase n=1 Tax=Escherichia coli TaxID=562 RepID=A0A0D3QUL6_ECOLX|nr:phosphomannomutase [Escherichia coli]EKH6187083.1 phosphomannomutase [Escherichia coli O26]EKK2305282.1 phosphomannomutase [Escherichia coli OX25]EKY3874691.1 phosphomannomutase [Escherichia coli O157]AJR19420.1 phosphomannomutase [Escherichia coli]EES1563770.1 phosphomannomutase [Escherichia coli]